MKFGTWNVRSRCRSGSFTTAAREFARYTRKLGLVGVQEVRWDKSMQEALHNGIPKILNTKIEIITSQERDKRS